MIYENNLLQGDLTEFCSVILLAKGTNVIDLCLHNSPGIPEVRYNNLSDGWYTGYQISIPDQKWLDYTLDTCPETLRAYDNIYFIKDSVVYKYNYWNNTISSVESKDIISNVNGNTNIKISYLDFFVTDSLREQFISLLEQSLQSKNCKASAKWECCKSEKKTTENLVETRDQLNNILDLIQIYIECQDFESAQDLLDTYNNCFKQPEKICCRRPL